MEILAALAAGLTILVLTIYFVRVRALSPADTRLRVLTPLHQVSMDPTGDGGAILRRAGSSLPFVNRLLDRRGYADRWRFDLERAGLSLRPGEYFLIRALAAAVSFIAMFLLFRNWFGVLLALVVGAVMFMLPALWVGHRMQKRVRAIEAQLLETISLISSAQRTGFAFAQGVEVAARRMGPPISVELNRMLLDINMGASTEDALAAMNERAGSEDLDLLVTAILIQRQTGGNLVEVLDNITEIMRDRERIQGEIRTLTSTQRLSGWILSLWPAALGLLFFAINPGMMSLMWTTVPGIIMLVTWGTLNLMGVITMRRILDIDI